MRPEGYNPLTRLQTRYLNTLSLGNEWASMLSPQYVTPSHSHQTASVLNERLILHLWNSHTRIVLAAVRCK
jgi:hypothetical protein